MKVGLILLGFLNLGFAQGPGPQLPPPGLNPNADNGRKIEPGARRFDPEKMKIALKRPAPSAQEECSVNLTGYFKAKNWEGYQKTALRCLEDAPSTELVVGIFRQIQTANLEKFRIKFTEAAEAKKGNGKIRWETVLLDQKLIPLSKKGEKTEIQKAILEWLQLPKLTAWELHFATQYVRSHSETSAKTQILKLLRLLPAPVQRREILQRAQDFAALGDEKTAKDLLAREKIQGPLLEAILKNRLPNKPKKN
ncbi:MAG: hypothetical protein JNL01_13230 [Bdellovibrionales bacterium]|nr:hypothetical protein [Bdellovibrionales bacterium]